MKDLIGIISQAIVDYPEQITITEIEGDQTTLLELKAAKKDMGKIIGKHGRTAQPIGTILSAASGKAGRRYILEIMEGYILKV